MQGEDTFNSIYSITDDDGQFLLIESAHYLPKWLKPETAENRVNTSSTIIITIKI